ncbi:MAG: DNA topoisomerase I [Candidatus Micrarchaeota archaeon]|nr:DNA topoisomerase I [Candidatus Micrarchaeota archaeon]
MAGTLVIAEKPQAAQRIAAALADDGVKQVKKRGAYWLEAKRGEETIYVVPAVGHLFGLKAKEKGGGYPVWDVEWKPSWETSKYSEFSKKYLQNLEEVAKKASRFVVATDWDLEGSLIGFNILRFVCNTVSSQRMKFSTLTADELRDAFLNPLEMDRTNALAGETRHVLDWLWGINFSRALMHAIKSAGAFRIMSIGRVQGPVLALLAQREKEIAAFTPVPFWQLFALVDGTRFLHVQKDFWKKEEAEQALAACKKQGTVKSVTRKKYQQQPPTPYDLTTLQVDAYRCFGFVPAQTMKIAQSLYEAAVISYPRTASQKLPEKLNLKKIIQSLEKNPAYSELAGQLVKGKRFKPREGSKEDEAHPAIHPTGQKPGKMGDQEAKLYDLVTKRFLACFADAATRESQRVEMMFGTQLFFATGSVTVEEGWLKFFQPYVKTEESELPQFTEGEKAVAEKIWMEDKQTQPPSRYSPASIVKEMEERGLGTKATRAEIVETLYSRDYITDNRSMKVTDFGMAVHDALMNSCPDIMGEELTHSIEKELEAVQESKKTEEEVIASGRGVLGALLEKFKEREKEVGAVLLKQLNVTQRKASILGKCVKCGEGDIVIKKSKFGYFAACNKYPACKTTYPFPHNASIIATGKACEKCGTPVITVRRAGRRPFRMCLDTRCETKANWGKKKTEKEGEKTEEEGSA